MGGGRRSSRVRVKQINTIMVRIFLNSNSFSFYFPIRAPGLLLCTISPALEKPSGAATVIPEGGTLSIGIGNSTRRGERFGRIRHSGDCSVLNNNNIIRQQFPRRPYIISPVGRRGVAGARVHRVPPERFEYCYIPRLN